MFKFRIEKEAVSDRHESEGPTTGSCYVKEKYDGNDNDATGLERIGRANVYKCQTMSYHETSTAESSQQDLNHLRIQQLIPETRSWTVIEQSCFA